jgi:hypothetical protein
MSTRLTTGLLSCLMASLFVGCASSPESLIRGQSPSAYPMPAGAYTGHGFGAYSQGVPFPYNTVLGRALQSNVRGKVNAYYGTSGSPAYPNGGYRAAGFPGSAMAIRPVAYAGGGSHPGAACENGAPCENGYCEDRDCHQGFCFGDCLYGHGQHGHAHCDYCKGRGCPHCKGTGYRDGGAGHAGHGDGGQWAPTHLYHHMYKIPQGMVYPQNPTPGAITVYPYYTHKGPDDFFYPPLKK